MFSDHISAVEWSNDGHFEHGSVSTDRCVGTVHMPIARRLVASCYAKGSLAVGDTVEHSLQVFFDHISAVELSFRARIGATVRQAVHMPSV